MLGRERRVERRQERREERHGGGMTHYAMREKLIAFGDDFWIEDEGGQRVFKVNGKALRVRSTLDFEDLGGNTLCRIQERMLRVKDSMEVESPGGERLALVKKALISPLRDRFHVQVAGGPDLEVKGNILDHEYTIGEDGDKIAEVSKRWFRVRDTYGVEVAPGQNDLIVLAVTVCLDQMAHD